MTEQTSKYRYRVSIFQLFSSTILFGVSFVGQKHAVASGIGPLTYTACRFAISTLLLLLFQPLLQHSFHSEVNIESSHNDSFDTSMVTKELLKYAALCGFSSFSASNLQQIGLQTVSAGKAAFITGMYVVFVPIAEYFLPGFGSKLNWRVWFSVLISFIGKHILKHM
jgi:drug/metabolite transporter (DMT)-like permease